jgi:hypothetical protein
MLLHLDVAEPAVVDADRISSDEVAVTRQDQEHDTCDVLENLDEN